jgi:VanZ family protein
MAVIFLLSSIPNLGPLPGGMSDKTGHFVGYAILGAAALRAFARGGWSGVTPMAARLAVLLAAAYGATDEFHQRFVPGRTSAFDDWAADVFGAVAVVALALVVGRLRSAGARGPDRRY